MKRFTILLAISISCILALGGCSKKDKDRTDLTSTHTTAAQETMAPSTTALESKELETSQETHSDTDSGNETVKEPAVSSVTTSMHTYTSGNIIIEYPTVSNLSQTSVQDKVNKLLKEHALEIIDAYSIDGTKDTLFVKCSIKGVDRRRVTAVYTGSYLAEGSAYPLNIFYTNTIDTVHGEDMELSDYADPYTLAGYVLSDDCQFYQVGHAAETEIIKIKNDTDIDTYTAMFRRADFPYKEAEKQTGDTEAAIHFPEVFSYEEQGTIYVSIPVTHALGDYALIKYTPDTK